MINKNTSKVAVASLLFWFSLPLLIVDMPHVYHNMVNIIAFASLFYIVFNDPFRDEILKCIIKLQNETPEAVEYVNAITNRSPCHLWITVNVNKMYLLNDLMNFGHKDDDIAIRTIKRKFSEHRIKYDCERLYSDSYSWFVIVDNYYKLPVIYCLESKEFTGNMFASSKLINDVDEHGEEFDIDDIVDGFGSFNSYVVRSDSENIIVQFSGKSDYDCSFPLSGIVEDLRKVDIRYGRPMYTIKTLSCKISDELNRNGFKYEYDNFSDKGVCINEARRESDRDLNDEFVMSGIEVMNELTGRHLWKNKCVSISLAVRFGHKKC